MDLSILSPEDGNRSSSTNVSFSIYSDFRTKDKVHKIKDSAVHCRQNPYDYKFSL
jgi:hypothetical protein